MDQAMVHKNRKIVSKVKNMNKQSWAADRQMSREVSQDLTLTKHFPHVKDMVYTRTNEENLDFTSISQQHGGWMIDKLLSKQSGLQPNKAVKTDLSFTRSSYLEQNQMMLAKMQSDVQKTINQVRNSMFH